MKELLGGSSASSDLVKRVDRAISDTMENRTGANYLRQENNMESGAGKKKKRKLSSPRSGDEEEASNAAASNSDSESASSGVQKKKPAKKKKKVKLPKGPKRWDEVNVEADRRYFDVTDNIESGNTNVV